LLADGAGAVQAEVMLNALEVVAVATGEGDDAALEGIEAEYAVRDFVEVFTPEVLCIVHTCTSNKRIYGFKYSSSSR
jgi:hypothetical protein